MSKAPKTNETVVTIHALTQHSVKLRIVGTTPLFMNRMAEKARQSLFLGSGKKTAAEKTSLKHDPFGEMRHGRLGEARQGSDGLGEARQARHGMAWIVMATNGVAGKNETGESYAEIFTSRASAHR